MTRLLRLFAIVCTTFMSFYATAANKLVITAVYPASLVEGTRNVSISAAGADFPKGAVAYVDGKAMHTVVQGSTMALFILPVTPASVQVTIHAANGAVSNAFPLKVVPATPTSPKTPVTPVTPVAPVAPVTPVAVPVLTPSTNGVTTWYVRVDGGTRYSAANALGQCNGLANAPYSGDGVNQNCAFSDVRYLWTDGTYCGNNDQSLPCWQWIGKGGDNYMILGSIANGVSYRIGQNGPNSGDYFGLAGNPYGAGIPVPPSGTANAHTKILGGNFASCSAQTARTQLHGGYGVGTVLDMSGAAYVDVACLDITDFSQCGRIAQTHGCQTGYPIDDYATQGVAWSNQSTHDTLTDIRIHGLASLGMVGPTGDNVVMSDIALMGNAGAGWSADLGNGTTGVGSLLVQNFNISWNGCAEEYPIVDGTPYQDCTDDNVGGYGDGFGTSTVPSPAPGWQIHFDQGTVSYNTQDGLDGLHATGVGTSVTYTRVLAYGNMGQQLKAGSGSSTVQDSQITTNCNAMRQAIPGTPNGYNSRLSDFCRAADTGMAMAVGKGQTFTFDNNTVYSDSSTTVELDCDNTYGACDSTTKVDYRNNIFLGFLNSVADGYPNGGSNDYANPVYNGIPDTGGVAGTNPFVSPGSVFSNNLTFHPKSTWQCPGSGETNAFCGVDPGLTDETWHLYGYANAEPLSTAFVLGRGVALTSIPTDILGAIRGAVFTLGAYQQ